MQGSGCWLTNCEKSTMAGRLKHLGRWLSYIRVVVGLVLLGLLIYYVDGSLLLGYWQDIEPAWLLIAAFCIFLSTLIGGYNIHLLLDRHEAIPYNRFIRGYWIAWAVGLVVPGQVGDVASLSVWLKRHGFQWHLSLGCALLDKLITLIWMGWLGLIGLNMYLNTSYQIGHLTLLVITGVTFIILLLWLWVRVHGRDNSENNGVIASTVHTIIVTVVQHKKQVLVNFMLTGLKVVLIGAAFWNMFLALRYGSMDIFTLVPLVAACSLVAYIPISFNGMGTVEIAAVALFSVLSVPDAAVISAFLAMRITVLLLAWIPVLLLMLFSGRPLTE